MDVIVQGLATNLDGYLQLEIGLANYELKEMMARTEVKAGMITYRLSLTLYRLLLASYTNERLLII